MTTRKQAIVLKKKALKRYLTGSGRDKICSEIKISHQTFDRWKKDGKWEQKLNENQAEVMRDLGTDIVQEKARSLKLIKAAEAKYAHDLQNSVGLPDSTSKFSQLQKVKWDILMPRNQNQINLIKQNNVEMEFDLSKLQEAIRNGKPYR